MNDIHILSKVRLKENLSEVYRYAPERAHGLIKDKRQDDGFELVYISWDREDVPHKEEDGWTFANHFEVIGESNDLLPTFTDDEKEEEEEVDEEEYTDLLIKAMDVAADSEAFFVMAIKRVEDKEGVQGYVPHGFALSRNETSGILLEAQIIQLAAEAHHHSAMRAIGCLWEEDDD